MCEIIIAVPHAVYNRQQNDFSRKNSLYDSLFPPLAVNFLPLCSHLFTSVSDIYFLFSACKPKIDLTFVIDACSENDRFTKANFVRVKNFLIRLIGEFSISVKRLRISLVLYAQYPKLLISFSARKPYIVRVIGNMKLVCGARYTGAALKYAYTRIIRRTSRKSVLVLMTTGASRDDVRGATALLQRSRVETFSVGIGRRYSFSELQYIASDRRHVYTAAYRNLESIVTLVKMKICKSGLQQSSLGLIYFLTYLSTYFIHSCKALQ